MEEWVGQWWHKAITRIAAAPPNAERVLLTDVQRSIALLFRETLRKLGGEISVNIGTSIAGADLPHAEGKQAVADALRQITYALDETNTTSATPYVWPKHVSF